MASLAGAVDVDEDVRGAGSRDRVIMFGHPSVVLVVGEITSAANSTTKAQRKMSREQRFRSVRGLFEH